MLFRSVLAGVSKSIFFGAAIAMISCYKGFTSRSGAEGVGRAATEAFVLNFIVILIINLFMAIFLNRLYVLLYGPGQAPV